MLADLLTGHIIRFYFYMSFNDTGLMSLGWEYCGCQLSCFSSIVWWLDSPAKAGKQYDTLGLNTSLCVIFVLSLHILLLKLEGHFTFLILQMLPPGDWRCPNCTCKFCGKADDDIDNTTASELPTCNLCERKCIFLLVLRFFLFSYIIVILGLNFHRLVLQTIYLVCRKLMLFLTIQIVQSHPSVDRNAERCIITWNLLFCTAFLLRLTSFL